MSKIKILYTIPNFDTAGSTKVVYDLINGLDKNKFEIEIACQHNKGAFFKEVEALGFPIHIMETTVPYRPYFSIYSRLRPIIHFFKSKKYDIIHSWDWSSDWTEALAARLAGVKWIYTKKAMSWGNRHWKIRSFLANYIITINEEMKNYFPNKKNQKLIPIGIDTDYYDPKIWNTLKDLQLFKIITVANLVPVKGIEVLLKALHLMQDPSVELMVVGDNENEYGKMLLQLCKELNIENNVSFTGKVADVRPLIEASDVYVIPTLDEGRKEGMPMALVEAMCMATPVLGSDISGINYVLKKFPQLLFKAGNEEELKNKLIGMKNTTVEERSSIGLSLRNYCIEQFSMGNFIYEHETLYKSL
jgi:glycosyltransferase involved in cell wall biosynthesis